MDIVIEFEVSQMSDDVSRADALRATTGDGTGRRRVLGGVVAAVGAALGLPGAASAAEATRPGAAGVGPNIPTCDPGCGPDLFCCQYDGSNCIKYCLYCTC